MAQIAAIILAAQLHTERCTGRPMYDSAIECAARTRSRYRFFSGTRFMLSDEFGRRFGSALA
ncbi:hypothetical protein [Streptomyces botrytidirepellens]|uniref:hypothetical protein n=1 Tax=Streptomyces botrytidirepellens TaxID=2486417 RepID=UPI0011CE4059|nr:hypothetical protein [Streptomyces botrytidirepellens]